MAERPLLLLPEAVLANRGNRGGGGGGPSKLAAGRQQQRVGPRLLELEAAFESKRVQLQTSTSGVVPEDVLVLETAGKVDDFIRAVTRIEGFEFLGEYDEQDIPPDDDFFVDKDGTRSSYTGRVYLVFSNQEAFRQLQRLWQEYQSGGVFRHGLTKWRDVFSLLREIRPWGVSDRLEETGVLVDWNDRVQRGDQTVHCEIELWYRAREAHRQRASSEVRRHVEALGGTVLSEAVVVGIHYHGLAVQLPIAAVQRVLDGQTRAEIQLVSSELIQFFRAAGQLAARASMEMHPSTKVFTGTRPTGNPRVALLDGLPLQNHSALANRLLVDDPDGFETDYRVDVRIHGTAMASLILWGDLNETHRSPIPHPLYVRPIMRPVFPSAAWANEGAFERVPEGALVVDLVHRAVRRLFEADGPQGPVAPDVAVVNFSVAVLDRPFSGTLSPLARLLDWLSWKYGVLFVVSAGNYLDPVDTGRPWNELQSLPAADQTTAILQAVAADTRNRRTLSPAEAMNVVTVGALHADSDTAGNASNHIDPMPRGYPSPMNGHGLGYRRSIKPDLLAPGGRLPFDRPLLGQETRLRPTRAASTPGIEVAAPGALAGDLTHTAKSRGSSMAAALLTRAGAFLTSSIASLRETPRGSELGSVPDAVILKMLLAHGARWGDLGSAMEGHFEGIDNRDKLVEQLTRLMGFGRLEINNVAECSPTRVTAIGAGLLELDRGVEHRFPLPPSLSGKRGWRQLTVTLAWFTPVNPLSHKWRQAHLWFEMPTSKLRLGRVGPDWRAAQRGTLQHDTFEGESASAFLDDDDVVVRVSCREDAPGLSNAVPYALGVTLEVAPDLDIDIYTEVRDRIRQRLRVSGGPAVP